MATVKKGSGTTMRRRGGTAAKKAAVTEQGPNGRQPHENAAAARPSIEMIRVRAYEVFLTRGGTHGDDLADWFRAEQELRAAHSS
ncbi:MAG TPA: DUF2934 domain-containing protein [Candidatus Binataceae bacterium]|nr:DUF2934 domain-containing protein [Candidatus Binataceae bacterium]